MQIHICYVGVPLLLMVVLAALIWSRKGPHPQTYQLSESWTHPPILWAATDEHLGGGHAGHPEPAGKAVFSVGGGASGTW
ncbi:MAG: hypothetical protein K2Q25_13675 [Mycobacteriaceae bacterium]|nr:hypothetical protein [Mycobacteriaceae bacterium]